jgi:hypothetical protein
MFCRTGTRSLWKWRKGIESAWVAVRKDPALTLKYSELIRRMSKQEAIIRIAKKLLNRIRFVWKNNTCYSFALVA